MSGDKNWSSEKECEVDGMRKQHQPACHTAGLPYPPPSSWPSGTGFATGTISLGEVDAVQISTFEDIWSSFEGGSNDKGVTIYKPVDLPSGYSVLGYYGQDNSIPETGWVLAVKENQSHAVGGIMDFKFQEDFSSSSIVDCSSGKATAVGEFRGVPGERTSTSHALTSPVDYVMVWSSQAWNGKQNGHCWFWLPVAPEGYKAVGFLATNTEEKPGLDSVVCVRMDLTEDCIAAEKMWDAGGFSKVSPFSIWGTKPRVRGVTQKGVDAGCFSCFISCNADCQVPVACVSNTNLHLSAMPTLEQVQSVQASYGPTLVFHPDEVYLPSSVSWFFQHGALLYAADSRDTPVQVSSDGSNLPQGGDNDLAFWLDLPSDGSADEVKKGNLESAEVYIHVKPVYGGTFTDLATWIFYPFNGPSCAKFKVLNIPLGRVGEHVGDWEHYTLRVSNFTGELRSIYFSQHSAGMWHQPFELEYKTRNRPLIYVAKSGHPVYAHEGVNLQGDEKRGIGLRNDTMYSNILLDTREKYQIIAAEYMLTRYNEEMPKEPPWLQYMREWGPKFDYDKTAMLNNILKYLPQQIRVPLQDIISKLPDEVLGQEGPTGPKQKNNWFGDERDHL
ncbi:unnamed protein product [Sphagnum balticum]